MDNPNQQNSNPQPQMGTFSPIEPNKPTTVVPGVDLNEQNPTMTPTAPPKDNFQSQTMLSLPGQTVSTELPLPTLPQLTGDLPAPTSETETPVVQITTNKKGVSPVVIAVIAFLMITALSGATFVISKAINSQQAVAPTAPVSQPAAFEVILPNPPSGMAVPDNSVDCSQLTNTVAYSGECFPVAIDDMTGIMYWIPQTGN